MQFFATRDIKAGEELCISYIDVSDPVEKHCEELARDWYFTCLCHRCENERVTAGASTFSLLKNTTSNVATFHLTCHFTQRYP